MATVTVTSTPAQASFLPRKNEKGTDSVAFKYTGSFGTAGDTALLAKIPHGATITSITIRARSDADTSLVVRGMIGPDGSSTTGHTQLVDTFTASSTGGPITARWNGVNFKFSASDDAAIQYTYLKLLTVAGTATATVSIEGAVHYTIDGQ